MGLGKVLSPNDSIGGWIFKRNRHSYRKKKEMAMEILLMVMVILGLARISAADFNGNLLVNSDFSQGNPSEESFGWTVELAEGEKNECTVVEGHQPGNLAQYVFTMTKGVHRASVRNVAVRPWRWYVAEVWVKSDGMYPSVVGFSLKGGRKAWRVAVLHGSLSQAEIRMAHDTGVRSLGGQ